MGAGFDRKAGDGTLAPNHHGSASGTAPGKRTLIDELPPVQRSASSTSAQSTDGQAIQQAAAQGVAGGGGALPHGETIQRLFGRHDVSGIEAYVGGPAAAASRAIGAEAYATGHHVAFASTPSLHTAAHEAAHVVQQRGGVQLKGGVGETGDAYEQHADEVADRVVRGDSAETLLDAAPGGAGVANHAVQRKTTIADDPADANNKTAPGTGAGLLKNTAGTTLPRSDVGFGPLVNGCGSSVTAWRYPGDDVTGSTPSVRPSWWAAMMADPSTDSAWVSNNVVQGHLLNQHLGGPGSDMRNLTPFAKSTNSQHHAYVEKKAKAIFGRGNVVRYKVTVNYGSPPPAAWFANKIPAMYLAQFPHSIECILDEYDPATGKSTTGKEDVTTITNAVTGQG
jgi:hypothetical protein